MFQSRIHMKNAIYGLSWGQKYCVYQQKHKLIKMKGIIFLTLENKYVCSLNTDLEIVWQDFQKCRWYILKMEGHRKDFNILRVQLFFGLWWLGEIVLKCVWVEVPALTIVRYINYVVIIPLKLLGSTAVIRVLLHTNAVDYTEYPETANRCHRTPYCQFLKSGGNRCSIGGTINLVC